MTRFDDGGDRPVDLGMGTVVEERPLAIKVRFDGRRGDYWFPKSAVHDNSEAWDLKNPRGKIIVQTWIARDKGLIK
jgi:hypothetical protein